MKTTILYFAIGCLVLHGCTKEIDLPLKDATPKIVIEANIDDTGDSALVRIQQTTPFKENTLFNGVPNATVIITDNNNHTYTLQPLANAVGVYGILGLNTMAGSTYKLHIEVNGLVYEAVSQVFAATPIDSIYTSTNGFFDDQLVTFDFHDPVGMANYYKADIAVNGKIIATNKIADDKYSDGIKKTLQFSKIDSVKHGDMVDVYFKSIDQNVYEYFRTLEINTSASGAAPANPISNISNGALGYFNACTVTKRRIYFP